MAGSDGSLYEGRGWHWQGAHTLGHNDVGYGVAFIGDYSSALPADSALALVRQRLAGCAVASAALVANYTVHGHRQLVSTTCPGDALYREISGWEHFGVRRLLLSCPVPEDSAICYCMLYDKLTHCKLL